MSSHPHDRQLVKAKQENDWSDDEWDDLVTQRLPADLELKAVELKAWQRRRGIRCITDLLRALLVYATWNYSFQQVGLWATLKGIGTITEKAWRNRVANSAAWIEWLVQSQFSGHEQCPQWIRETYADRRILLIDATRLKLPGGTGDDLRLHWCSDLLGSQMLQVTVTDRHQAEGLGHFQVGQGDIVVLDAGYPVASTVREAIGQKADVVVRTTASHLHLETEEAETIKLKDRIKRYAFGATHQIKGWVKDDLGKRYHVGLIVHRLPKEVALKAQERKRQRLQAKRGRHFNQELVWWAGWILLVTTLLQEQWPSVEVARLYRARWQIELIFKRLKQDLHLHHIPIKDWKRARLVVLLHLIVWSLQEESQHWMREQFKRISQPQQEDWGQQMDEEEAPLILSSWRLTQFCVEHLQLVLRGTWPLKRVQECLPLLQRYLSSHSRKKRPHQETALREWLLSKLSALGAPAVAEKR